MSTATARGFRELRTGDGSDSFTPVDATHRVPIANHVTMSQSVRRMSKSFRSNSVADTESIAREVAAMLRSEGDCMALHGDLGAGKTQFTRGLVTALGGEAREVSSPTFVLLNVYQTPRGSVFHLDAYRVAGPDEFASIGFDEFLTSGIVVVEWAERVAELLPADHLSVTISAIGRRSRRIEVSRATGNVAP
ncbi:MAG: tRNA (adenosine(37)-N6)-threonylcarbamoyltransferase complex ATPase subunit type 1 TsaE [Phycisphaerae bacterium]|nr:tRNA (adenosine(37)-N6)-threonylcarbamoyltransferase complex ATPase subunit type 1 TsaE [Phycisphaerae bacterium]